MTTHRSRRGLIAATLIAAVIAVILAGCGANDNTSSSVASSSSSGTATDRAFAAEMIPHHRSAVAMAKIARKQTSRPEIKRLAAAIVQTQNAEIARFKELDAKLATAGVATGHLGLSEAMMGMSMNDAMLINAKPFDRQFIDMMVPHHQGAIRMARIELAKGKNAELKKIAEDVVLAQSREIGQMNNWRRSWFGATSPSGGVPKAGSGKSGSSSESGMSGMSGMGNG